jgi:hypothetical protein
VRVCAGVVDEKERLQVGEALLRGERSAWCSVAEGDERAMEAARVGVGE